MELDVKIYVVMRDYKDSVNVPKIHTRCIVCLRKISHGYRLTHDFKLSGCTDHFTKK